MKEDLSQREEIHAMQVLVKGRVQRVGYRRYLLDLAQDLGISGYVKNMPDGSVQIFCQAPENILQQFIEQARNPPPPALIKQFDVREAKPRPKLKIFKIRYGTVQDELQEGFGAMQTIFMDYWREFRDYRQEFRDYREEFKDYREEFRDYRQEFRDYREEFRDYRNEFRDYRQEFRDFREEFRDYRNEFRSFVDEFRDYRGEFREFAKRTDENFKVIMDRYGEISQKLTVILETLVKESRETREMLNETMNLLREAINKLSKQKSSE